MGLSTDFGAQIKVHPIFNALYYSFYFWGLYTTLGRKNIHYSTQGFPRLHPHCLAFIIAYNSGSRNAYISAGDGTGFNQEGLDWCDVYAKVNIDPSNVPERYIHKIIPIGPSFGIRNLGFPTFLIHALQTYLLARSQIPSMREHLANYYRQWKYRLPIGAYVPGESKCDYIFFAASLWKKETENNRLRANFVEACKSLPGILFEGGLSPRNDIPEFNHLFMRRRVTHSEYLEKTKASAVVFNTPAVQSCLGWKLAEFLAMGKAVISSPLTRALPAPLTHGTHVHFVDGSMEQIQEAVKQICQDEKYRKRLEHNARQYYLDYLQPARVIERVLRFAYASL